MIKTAIIIAIFLLTAPFSANAQERELKDLRPGSTFSEESQEENLPEDKTDIEDIPPEYLAEMEEIYQKCNSNDVFSTYFDCRCQAMRFLDERIEAGPEIHPNLLMKKINKECVNTTGIAGYSYGVCEQSMMVRNFHGYKKLCECFANTVAKEYANRPYLESRNIISLQRDAYLSCGMADELVKRELAKKNKRPK